MKHLPCFMLTLAVLVSGPAAVAQDAPGPVEVERLAENLHVLRLPERPHTVMAVLTGPDGTLLVDYENPDLETLVAADAVRGRVDEALKGIGAWPVRFLVNTHWHPDHVGGNAALGPEALILSHRETRGRLAVRQTPWWLPGGVGPMPAAGLPEIAIDERLTLHLNGEEVVLLHLGPSHTEGDLVVWYKHHGVAHLGDLFHGFATVAVGRDMRGLAETYAKLLEILPADTRLVTGHGPIADMSQLERSRRLLDDTIARVEEALASGATLEQIQDRPWPAPWDEAWPGSDRSRRMLIEAIHRSLQESRSDDRSRLLALHREGIEAHLENDVDKLLQPEANEVIYGSRGELMRPTLEERRAMFGPYFATTRFETYQDVVPPVVDVSDDGTLGWVIAQVEVSGSRQRPDGERVPLEFGSAWIELYRKLDGRWVRTGNISSMR